MVAIEIIYMLYNWIKHLIKVLVFKYRWRGKLLFDYSCKISNRSIFEGMNKLYGNVVFDGYLGKGSYIARNSMIIGKVGRYTSIASCCTVILGIHPYTYPYVSTSPVFFSLLKQNGHSFTENQLFVEHNYAEGKYPVIIGNDCWIGYGVKMVSGVRIGDGAVVLAGSVVTKDIPPYAIVGGIPAKVIKYRYSEEDVAYLLNVCWWNKDVEWLRENTLLFLDIEKLKQNSDVEL